MSDPYSNVAAGRRLTRAFNDFALRLFSRIFERETGSNVILSPVGVVAALTVLYEGANGETKRALADTLLLNPKDVPTFNSDYARLRSGLANTTDGTELRIASALWAKKGLELRPDFVRSVRTQFETEVGSLDFAGAAASRAVNDWVKNATGGRIKELVAPDELSCDTDILLVSTVYFKGIWKTQFERSQTTDGTFTLPDGSTVSCPMMVSSGTYSYCESDRFRAIEIPYRNASASMLIFLPKDEASLGTLVRRMSIANWLKWCSQFRRMMGVVRLPRFKLSYQATLNEVLQSLGAGLAFDPDADFSNIYDSPGFLSEFKHTAAVEVTEEGAEAAAATVVALSRALSNNFNLTIDRPCLCVIRDNQTGLILFLGTLARP